MMHGDGDRQGNWHTVIHRAKLRHCTVHSMAEVQALEHVISDGAFLPPWAA